MALDVQKLKNDLTDNNNKINNNNNNEQNNNKENYDIEKDLENSSMSSSSYDESN